MSRHFHTHGWQQDTHNRTLRRFALEPSAVLRAALTLLAPPRHALGNGGGGHGHSSGNGGFYEHHSSGRPCYLKKAYRCLNRVRRLRRLAVYKHQPPARPLGIWPYCNFA